ncbi:MAG TPA: MnhB domain-containing protein [Planctomycetota bacterium]|nr:MnhB domain-containing protein [Planctomycetota bacterium]
MSGMTLIVKTIARLVVGFIFVFGSSVILHGHLSPGGGFAGGSMLACGLVLVLLAYGRTETRRIISENRAAAWDSVGAFAFLSIALFGYFSGAFFRNFLPLGRQFQLISSGTVMWSNVAIGIKVGACLFAAYLMLAGFRMSEDT